MMKRLTLFLISVGLLSSAFLLIQDAEGHGTKIGPTILVSESKSCAYPSTTILRSNYKAKFKVVAPNGASSGGALAASTAAPEVHWHTWSTTARLRPYMSNYEERCNTYRTVCNQIKYWFERCHRGDRDCNIFASQTADGSEPDGHYINYYIWIDDENDCWQELVL
ncbi:MAG: hypothetical protein OXN90_15900 [Gemmatimonadota bacterium]|nr:hypothetical protein [Gemmatimonadota bacterium]